MDDRPHHDDSNAEDPRQGFLRALPRKAVEIKAAFGALIADPRSNRMRDELRRRLHAFYTLARSYQLPKLAEEVCACVDILDATRAHPLLERSHIDALATHIAAFTRAVEQDLDEAHDHPSAHQVPSGTRYDPSRAPTRRVSLPGHARPSKHTLPPDDTQNPGEGSADGNRMPTVPYRTLPPGTTLRKGMLATSGQAAAVHVLFVGSAARANALHEALPAEVELLVTRTALDAAQRAHDTGPDVIVAETGGSADGVGLAQILRNDPVTEFFPLVLLASHGEPLETLRQRCPEAADVLPEHTDGATLWETIERLLGGAMATSNTYDLGTLTLDELTRILQDELRRGIVGAAPLRARDERIHLGPGNDVLTATWEAITRIRDVIERRSNGAVRFDLPTAPRGMPGMQVVTPGKLPPTAALAADDPLPGRTVLVVDDDPAVLATFGAILREAGANVHECRDGAQALTLSRHVRPDLLLCDIVMPGLDGLALCRAVRRDPSLRHVPIILLSWRDDLLARMREFGAKAQGYLRKEAGGDAILAHAREALRLRERILRRVRELQGSTEVRGRLERVGLYPLLEAAATLGDATVTVSDTASVTELHLRGGQLVSALRTAHDGSLVRGEAAFRPVLGITSARFTVQRSKTAVRENLQGPLHELLSRMARAMLCLEESVTGEALQQVHRLDLDREASLAYVRTFTGRLRTMLERVLEGEAPAELIAGASATALDLEPHLVELVRRGAVRGVYGPQGEDLVARIAARPERPVEPSPPTVVPAPAARPPRNHDDPGDVSLADAVWRELRDSVVDVPVRRKVTSPGPFPAATARPSPPPRPSEPPEVTLEPVSLTDDLPPLDIDPHLAAPAASPPTKSLQTPSSPVSAHLLAASVPEAATTRKVPSVDGHATTRRLPVASVPPEALASPAPLQESSRLGEFTAETLEIPDEVIETLQRDSHALSDNDDPEASSRATPTSIPGIAFEPIVHTGSSHPAPLKGTPPPPPATAARPPPPPPVLPSPPVLPQPTAVTSSTAVGDPEQTTPKVALTPPGTRSSARHVGGTEQTAPKVALPHEVDGWSLFRRTAWLLLAIGGAFAGAYYGVRAYLQSHLPGPAEEFAITPESDAAPSEAQSSSPTPAADAAFATTDIPTVSTFPPRARPPLGEYHDAAPWLDGGVLPPRMGLLVVATPTGSAAASRVEIDQRDMGVAPLHAVLSEGLHTVRFRDGNRWRYQFATVRAGQAVVLHPTLSE